MLHSSRALADVVIRVHVLSILVILLTVVLKKNWRDGGKKALSDVRLLIFTFFFCPFPPLSNYEWTISCHKVKKSGTGALGCLSIGCLSLFPTQFVIKVSRQLRGISVLLTLFDLPHKKCGALARLCSNGARSPEATNIWPRATENIFVVARPGDWLVLVSWFDSQKKKMLFNRACVDIQRSFHVNLRVT